MSERMRERYARSEARNQEVRERLEPLAPGERPGAVTIGAIAALGFAVANALALVLSEGDKKPNEITSTVGFCIVLVVCAAAMWRAKYWAVLGFQALLVIQIVIGTGLLLGATSWWTALVGALIVALGGWLFWKLIKAMARLQMPER